MGDINLLRRKHQQIERLARELSAILAQPAAPDALGFLHFRRTFGRLVTFHLKREDWVIYPRLRASRRSEVVKLAILPSHARLMA